MTPDEMIYKSVYQQCIKNNCTIELSRQSAKMAVQKYNSRNYSGSPSTLIKDAVTSASKFKQKKASTSWR